MDPESEGGLEEVRETLRETAKNIESQQAAQQAASADFDARLRNLSDIVFSLARTSSEHDVKIDKLIEIVAPLAQTVRNDHQTIARILEILASLAEADEQIRREFQERNARVDEEHRRLDEQIAILVRMMDEWVRRQPPNGKGA